MSTSLYSIPPLQRTCVSCQRCPRHCTSGCRLTLARTACPACVMEAGGRVAQPTCESCQRCKLHCFDDPDCRFRGRREICLTCSSAVAVLLGHDASRGKSHQKVLGKHGLF
jgi:hypothetical protein